MIIREHKWRRLLQMPYISIRGSWPGELNRTVKKSRKVHDPVGWTGIAHEYEWKDDVREWLERFAPRTILGSCRATRDFKTGEQARLWFSRKRDAAMFKLTFDGMTQPLMEEGLVFDFNPR